MRHLVFGIAAAAVLATAVSASAQTAQPAPPPPPPAAPPPPPPPAGVSASASVSVQPAPAPEADTVPSGERNSMNMTLSAFAALGYSYGFAAGVGVGARFQWVIVPQGFLHRLPKTMHDEFAIEPGFDYFHAGYSTAIGTFSESWDYNEFTPLVGVLWNFWLTDKLAVYPKIDVGYRIASWSSTVNDGGQVTTNVAHADLSPLYFQGAVGIDYRIGMVSLRAEAGWQVLRAGVGFTL